MECGQNVNCHLHSIIVWCDVIHHRHQNHSDNLSLTICIIKSNYHIASLLKTELSKTQIIEEAEEGILKGFYSPYFPETMK